MQPFGPSVLRVKIPEEIIIKLNDYVDSIVLDKSKSNDLNHGSNLVGDVTQEFKLEEKFMAESGWLKFLGLTVQKKTQALIQASMKLGEAVYKSQQKPNNKDQDNKNAKDNKEKDKDNVVDAEVVDPKDDKEKRA